MPNIWVMILLVNEPKIQPARQIEKGCGTCLICRGISVYKPSDLVRRRFVSGLERLWKIREKGGRSNVYLFSDVTTGNFRMRTWTTWLGQIFSTAWPRRDYVLDRSLGKHTNLILRTLLGMRAHYQESFCYCYQESCYVHRAGKRVSCARNTSSVTIVRRCPGSQR